MDATKALRVSVTGDLPKEVLEKVAAAVQKAVRHAVADIDLLKDYTEKIPPVPHDSTPAPSANVEEEPFGIPITWGVVYEPSEL